MSLLDSFMVALGFQVDTEGIDKFQSKSEELKASALRLGAVFTGAAVGLGLFVEKVAEGMGELYEFSELNKVSAREIQAWSYMGLEYGMTADSMRDSLGGLNRVLGQAAAGIGRGKMIFEKLGLSARDAKGHVLGLDDMLEQLSKKMQGKSRAENLAIASRLQMDPKMVLLLEQGADKLKALREEAEKLNPLKEEDYKLAHEVEVAFTKTNLMLGIMSKQIAVKLMPYVLKALETFKLWFKEMREGTAGRFSQALDIMTATVGTLLDWLVRMFSAVKNGLTWLSQFRWLIYVASTAIGLMVAYKVGAFFLTLADAVMTATKALFAFDAAAALPAILIGGIILLVALLVDELYNYYKGNETIIGQLEQKFHRAIIGAWTVLGLLIAGFIALKWAAISSMMETIAIMAMYAASWISAHAAMAVATLAAYWPILLIIGAIVLVVGAIWYLWTHWDKVTGMMRKAWTWVVDHIREGIMWLVDKFELLTQKGISFIKALPGGTKLLNLVASATGTQEESTASQSNSLNSGGGVIGRAGSNISNSTATSSHSTEIHAPITVVSPDPDKAGASVKKELDQKTRQSIRNGQTAVAL